MNKLTKRFLTAALAMTLLLALAACGGTEKDDGAQPPAQPQQEETQQPQQEAPVPGEKEGELVPAGAMPLEYAKNFSIDLYEDGYRMIHAGTAGFDYLVVPEGKAVPEELGENVKVLQLPIERVYMGSTSMASLVDAIGALDNVKLVSTKEESWYVDGVTERMADGRIVYAGSYKEPDYELMTTSDIQLHVDTPMIDNNPEVLEKFAELGIPSLVENSSQEEHPLGRVEWVKLFGVLFGREAEAEAYFEEQKALVDAVSGDSTGVTAAMGYITSSDKCYSRNGGDYMVKMIGLAGGEYILADMEPEKTGNTNMTFEDFYASNKDADCLFYVNFARSFTSLQEMIDYNPLFADFKAVQEGSVWVTSPNFTQSTAEIAEIISDMHTVMTDREATTEHLIKLS